MTEPTEQKPLFRTNPERARLMEQRVAQIQETSLDLEIVRNLFSELGGVLVDTATRQPDAAGKLDKLLSDNNFDNVWTLVNVGTYLIGIPQLLDPNAPYHPRHPRDVTPPLSQSPTT